MGVCKRAASLAMQPGCISAALLLLFIPLCFLTASFDGVKSSLASEDTQHIAFIGGYKSSAEGALI